MKLNTSHIFQIILILINSFLIITYSNAKTNQNEKIIQIYSRSQITNMLTNTIIFQDQVTLKYQNINIYANKILVHYVQDKYNYPTIKAYGNPVTLYQTKNKLQDAISAQSLIVYYDANHHIITLIGKAYIKKSGHSIYSDKITYTIKDKQIKATANPGNQVITTLIRNAHK